MKTVGALWRKTGKGNKRFLSGTLDLGAMGEISVMIFPNDRKDKKDRDPDFTICMPQNNKE